MGLLKNNRPTGITGRQNRTEDQMTTREKIAAAINISEKTRWELNYKLDAIEAAGKTTVSVKMQAPPDHANYYYRQEAELEIEAALKNVIGDVYSTAARAFFAKISEAKKTWMKKHLDNAIK
jgi:hypothetical protein